MDYRSKRVIVTGGSSGMGRALVRLLADRGARVSIVALAGADLESVMEEHTGRCVRNGPRRRCRHRGRSPVRGGGRGR